MYSSERDVGKPVLDKVVTGRSTRYATGQSLILSPCTPKTTQLQSRERTALLLISFTGSASTKRPQGLGGIGGGGPPKEISVLVLL